MTKTCQQRRSRDTIEIGNLPDPSPLRGCSVAGDKFTHLGRSDVGLTACGKTIGNLMLSGDVIVDCPNCVAEIRYRFSHPEAAKRKTGVVTHEMGLY